jgi:NAD(P)-dependent dehydrogenase (short-subunit alcohol dehydrogenase family)
VLGFTRALACELAPQGVRVNAVLPGYVATEIVRSLVAHGKVDPKQVASRVPLGRMAEPEEIAEPIVWAASNTYLAGAFIVADGGYHAFGGSGPASTGETFTAQTSDRPVVVVAGGASGIGAAVADHYVKKGDRVIVLDRVRSELSSSADDRVEMALDVTDYNAVEHTFKLIAERFGTIDTLVNNTAVEDQLIASTDQSLERFRHDISVNLVGPFAIAQAAARIVMASGGGAVINLMSIAAFDEAPGPLSHCAVESGIGMMTRSLACEWAVAGIRVNAVASGHIETPGVKAPEASGNSDIDAVHQRIPMARRGRAEEIADAVDFLASPRSSYVTGSIYVVDGGWTACQARY